VTGRGRFFLLGIASFLLAVGPQAAQAHPTAIAMNDSSCFQPACPKLSVSLEAPSSTMVGDRLNTLTIVVRNTDSAQPATILAGTTLVRSTFSEPVGYRFLSANPSAICDVQQVNFTAGTLVPFFLTPAGAVPQTRIDCVAGQDDTIAAGDSRAIAFQVGPPSRLSRRSVDGRLRVTVQLDPNGVIPNDPDATETSEASFTVTPSTLIELAPDAATVTVDPGDIHDAQTAAAFRKSSLACSGVANVAFIQVIGVRTTFSPVSGSMTCDVSLHPADTQSGPLAVAPGTVVLILEVDDLEFHSLAARPSFACFGATVFNEADNAPSGRHGLKIYCQTKETVDFALNQDRSLLSFSGWISGETHDLDWGFCPYPFTASDLGSANLSKSSPVCGALFGGSAGD
jgi:hypothetical protein